MAGKDCFTLLRDAYIPLLPMTNASGEDL